MTRIEKEYFCLDYKDAKNVLVALMVVCEDAIYTRSDVVELKQKLETWLINKLEDGDTP